MGFNTKIYDPSSKSFNILDPIYIDGSNDIPISGTTWYPGIFGNVMASFIVDASDTILDGNVIVTGDILFGKISQSSTTGSYLNTQFGDAQSFQHISSTSSGGSPITGYQNVALGGPTLISITTGSGNLAIGSYSLMSLTTGFQNTGVGCVRFIKLLMVVLILP